MIWTKSGGYLDKISQSSLYNKIPGEDPIVVHTDYFDMLIAKVTPCIINNTNYTMNSNTPVIYIDISSSTIPNCSEEWDLQYYAFKDRSQIFNCGVNSSPATSEIMIKIKNAAGIEITSGLNIRVDMPGIMPCPSGCTLTQTNSNKNCACSLSLFDVKSQIRKIFRGSDLDKAFKLSSAGWLWYSSPVFWVVSGLFVWFIITLLTVLKRLKDYCIIENFLKSKKSKSCIRRIITTFIVNLP